MFTPFVVVREYSRQFEKVVATKSWKKEQKKAAFGCFISNS